jgi:hypothetical protein
MEDLKAIKLNCLEIASRVSQGNTIRLAKKMFEFIMYYDGVPPTEGDADNKTEVN